MANIIGNIAILVAFLAAAAWLTRPSRIASRAARKAETRTADERRASLATNIVIAMFFGLAFLVAHLATQ